MLDLPASFCERIIEYGLERYPERFSIQNCQLTGRREGSGMISYDLVQKYRMPRHHGIQSLAERPRPNGRMGSIEMPALNIAHAEGEYWELWHGDGFRNETSTAVTKFWQEPRQLGYDGAERN